MSKVSKYMYDARAWEEAGGVLGACQEPPASVETRADQAHYFREVVASALFAQRRTPEGAARLPQGALFWAKALAHSPALMSASGHARQAAFGQWDPPFASLAEAQAWLLKQKPASERADRRDAAPMYRADFQRWEERRPAHPPGLPVVVRYERLAVDFPGPDGALQSLYAHTPQLARLARGALQIAEIAGWHRAFATVYILCGQFPVNAWGPLTWHSGGGIPWLEIRLSPAALNAATFRHILRLACARVWRECQEKPPQGQDAALLDIVQELGAPPEGKGHGTRVGRTQYWQTVTARWNQLNRSALKPDALRKRWERLIARAPNLSTILEGRARHGTKTRQGSRGR